MKFVLVALVLLSAAALAGCANNPIAGARGDARGPSASLSRPNALEHCKLAPSPAPGCVGND